MTTRNLFVAARIAAFLLAANAWQQIALSDTIVGIAAMGASETQGANFDGSWVPWLAIDRGLNFGPGQSYNRAIGGSDTDEVLSKGQHTQVAALVAGGQVNLAYLTIGGLNFPPAFVQIVTGTLDTNAFVNNLAGDITTAMDTVLAAGPTKMIVAGVPDMTLTGGGQRLLTTPAVEPPVAALVDQVNAEIKTQVLARGQTYFDFAGLMRAFADTPLVVGGVTIDTVHEGSSPEYLWLNDLHVAMVGNGLFANMYLSALNKTYGTNYPLFSDEDILTKAGLLGQYVGHQTSNIDYQSFVYVIVPEPSTAVLALAAASGTALALRRKRVCRGRGI